MVSDEFAKFEQEPQDEVQHLLDAAIEFFEEGDLRAAALFLRSYLLKSGTQEALAKDYMKRIGTAAFSRARRYQEIGWVQQARNDLTFASSLGGESENTATEILKTLPLTSAPKSGALSSVRTESALKPDRLWRRPHMDLSKTPPLSPGDSFEVYVYADQSDPRPGEEANPIELPSQNENQYELEVRMHVSEHFRIEGTSTKPFRIEKEKTSTETVAFSLVTKDARTLQMIKARPVALCAEFLFKNRPAGKVLCRPQIVGVENTSLPEPPKGQPAGTNQIVVESAAKSVDLLITITSQSENDNRHFWCTVQTELLTEYTKGVTQEWVTAKVTNEMVAGYMQEFTKRGLSKIQRLTKLRGAGKELFKASPEIFQNAFWKLIDSNATFSNISIISDEPFIPWELMIPYRNDHDGVPPAVREPLGVEFCIGRMCRRTHTAGAQRIPLGESYVLAPVFEGQQNIPHAQEEAEFVIDVIPGERIAPATFESLDKNLAHCRSLLHIASHGETSRDAQVLYLDEEKPFSTLDLYGLPGAEKGIPIARPLVFLNACQVGRPIPSLVGIGGFATTFIEMGACAVVAPLWSVKDEIAHEIAMDFYGQLKADDTIPMAEILRRQRAKAYDPEIAEDTYAAYCFYGDPLAVAVRK